MDPDPEDASNASVPDEKTSKLKALLSRAQEPDVLSVRFSRQIQDEERGLSYLAEAAKPDSYDDIVPRQGCEMIRSILIQGNRNLRCYLLWLPIHVRYRIYQLLFSEQTSPIEIGGSKHHKIGNLEILRTSHLFYHEASIALFHCLSDRFLYFKNYGAESAGFLRGHPMPLPCCRNRSFEKWLEYPCRNEALRWKRTFRAGLFLIGASELLLTVQRRWSFAVFITALKIGEPLRFYDLTVVLYNDWKIPGFDEEDLVRALFSGAVEVQHKLTFRGLAEDEKNRVSQLIHALKLPTVKVQPEKIEDHELGLSILLYTLKHKINYAEKNLTIGLRLLKSKADNKQSLLVRGFCDNGTCYLASVQLTNCFMSRSSTTKQRSGRQATHWKETIVG